MLKIVNSADRPVLFMLCGLPGSGKSFQAEKLSLNQNAKIVSSDAIREELFQNINEQNYNNKVFEVLKCRVKDHLLQGENVIIDSTNISWKRRKAFLQELNNIPCWKYCLLIATPFEICLERNSLRDRKVPYDVIERMYKNFDIPWYNEGWDNIWVEYTDDNHKDMYGDWSRFILSTMDFNQESKWHKDTLGDHCLKTLQFVRTKENELNCLNEAETKIAAALHDCGKPFCKTFKDSKGNPSEFAHYYCHEHTGSYDSLFHKMDEATDRLLVAALIRWHMIPHFFKDWPQKTIDKYVKEFTEHKYLQEMDFYKALKLLHEGDKNAH